MWCTVLRRLPASVLIILALVWSSIAPATELQTGASVVARLYKDFAWMAIGGEPALFGADLSHQPKPVLEKYFDPALTAMLVADAKCQVKYRGICNLDFDLLFASQDPSVVDLDIQASSPGRVSVAFKNPVSGTKTRLEFRGAPIAGKWKITDIIYTNMDDASLKNILSRKIP